jgi:hypothetical protein
MSNGYPTTKTQDQVLQALGLTARDYAAAERLFQECGLQVTSRRAGRNTVPVVRKLAASGGGWNASGDGTAWTNTYQPVDFSKLAQWM